MGKSITVQKIIAVLLSRIKFIVLLSVIVGMLFFLYSKFMIAPMYSTSAMMYVQNYDSRDKGDKSESINEKNKKIVDEYLIQKGQSLSIPNLHSPNTRFRISVSSNKELDVFSSSCVKKVICSL